MKTVLNPSIAEPRTASDLIEAFASARQRGERIGRVDLSGLAQVIDYTPEDLVVRVQAGITLAGLQATLARHRQWLPIDPPFPESTSIAEILAFDRSGPRRFAYGTIREHLLGLQVVLPEGRLIKSGGQVVKNVAGYDLCKLFVGDHQTLGVVVEATFKLRPLPEAEQCRSRPCASFAEAAEVLQNVLQSPLTPVILDAWGPCPGRSPPAALTLVVGFAGTREEVDAQIELVGGFGFREAASLDYEARFHRSDAAPPHRLAMLPSRWPETVEQLGAAEFVARAGNGVVAYRGGPPPPVPALPGALLRRVKETFDPHHLLPDLPW